MKKIILVVAFSMLGTLAFAQWGDEQLSDKPDWKDRVFTGGGLGGGFSSYYDYISVSPLIGYRITQKLAGGFQFQYRYTKYKNYTPSLTTNNYGVGPFLRFSVFGPFFIHTEYEYLSYEYLTQSGEKLRTGFDSFMAGGGFFQPIGRSAGIFAMALYNFSYRESTSYYDVSPYNSPLILRVGITAGF